ncbi:MAG: GTPase HflX [Spirochaetia bacterium]|nr:GTPase HflX [Spirochaetia bacterium]
MVEILKENTKKIRCLLVGEPLNDLAELKSLVSTLQMETVFALTLTRLEVQPVYGMGKGKAEEICALAKEKDAECIIFDFDLDPGKQKNWEKLCKIPCFDRQEVIIRIFAQRARTKEAVLQVELARLTYSLPRLSHSYGDMARQRGGSYGSKGSGETQLELDQRSVREKIFQLKREILEVEKTRLTQEKKRRTIPVPECALVGYTNAGKSSLLNALTGSDSFVEDKLFATLDPLTRKLKLKDGSSILLTDTVGFISRLPHTLIDAFKSTLSQAEKADLLILVLDSSDKNIFFEYETVLSVLKEIGADEKEKLIVLNKIDLVDDELFVSELKLKFPDSVCVSAKTRAGFEKLSEKISEKLLGDIKLFFIPLENHDILKIFRSKGVILKELWLDDGILISARCKEQSIQKFRVKNAQKFI